MREPIPVPALDSNYFWLIPGDNRKAWVVDPGDATPVLEALQKLKLSLEGILITHHHWDHTDGLEALLAKFDVPVYGPESVPEVTHVLTEGDRVALFETTEFGVKEPTLEVLAVPGHTLDHLAYYQPGVGGQPPRLFCGDALFAAGCGRLFEGTASQALDSLNKLNKLPAETLIYCAHEYTLDNLRFARTVDPDNPAVLARLEAVSQCRARGEPTLPSSLDLERDTNPYLRTGLPGIRKTFGADDAEEDASVFAELRRRKDRFR